MCDREQNSVRCKIQEVVNEMRTHTTLRTTLTLRNVFIYILLMYQTHGSPRTHRTPLKHTVWCVTIYEITNTLHSTNDKMTDGQKREPLQKMYMQLTNTTSINIFYINTHLGATLSCRHKQNTKVCDNIFILPAEDSSLGVVYTSLSRLSSRSSIDDYISDGDGANTN